MIRLAYRLDKWSHDTLTGHLMQMAAQIVVVSSVLGLIFVLMGTAA